jgi:predicted dehydrogenase
MTKKLRIGIIGCGGIANGKHMPSLAKLTQVEMVAFCDIEVERAEEAASKFGIEGIAIYKDYKELLKDQNIDVVHVCTPNDSHAEITVAALEADKHVMCEKPMAKWRGFRVWSYPGQYPLRDPETPFQCFQHGCIQEYEKVLFR